MPGFADFAGFAGVVEINLMNENAIPRNTKHATKFGMTLSKDKMRKLS